jgi:hypothetical protein
MASYSGLNSLLSNEFIVNPSALDHFTIANIPSSVKSGAPLSPMVTAYDRFGNRKTDYNGVPEFVSSDTAADLPSLYQFRDHEEGTHEFHQQVSLRRSGIHWLMIKDGVVETQLAAITVTNAPPQTPEPLSPLQGRVEDLTPLLQAKPFIDLDGSHHRASQWQVADDEQFIQIVWDSQATTQSLTAIEVPLGNLEPHTIYYWRVRYQDNSGDAGTDWSLWSAVANAQFQTTYGLPFIDDFNVDRGWSGYQIDAWERGPAQVGGGAAGHQDPAIDHSPDDANMIAGFALGDDYPPDMESQSLISPYIDCSGQAIVELSFWRWLGIDENNWAHASIEVTNDGEFWFKVWENGVAIISDTSWQFVIYDISAITGNQPRVKIRFCMAARAATFAR